MAFWDASAIVPLCCSEPATASGRKLLKELRRMVVWWGTPVEARSAFARLVRDGRLTNGSRVTATRLLNQLRGSWDEIQPSEKVRSLAEGLPDDSASVPQTRSSWQQLSCGATSALAIARSSASTNDL